MQRGDMRRLAAATCLVLSASLGPALACDEDLFVHNGSRMSVRDCGSTLEIRYLEPREGLRAQGVAAGTLLVDGTISRSGVARTFRGRARLFRAGCAPATYPVDGTLVLFDRGPFELSGRAPRRAPTGCGLSGSRPDRLVFEPAAAPTLETRSDAAAPAMRPGEWQITDVRDRQLGIVILSEDLESGRGQLDMKQRNSDSAVVLRRDPAAASGLMFDVLPPQGKQGASILGWLTIQPTGSEAGRGQLAVGSAQPLPIRLRWVGTGVSEPEDAEDDLPAIGVYRPEYRIMRTQPGGDVALRAAEDPAAPVIGRLSDGARGIQVLSCAPDISTEAFETADRAGRERLLAGSTCRIADATGRKGFLHGRHLSPLD